MPPRRETTAARARQLTSPQTPFDLDRVRTYHDHGCLHCTKQRPSLPAKEWGGPSRLNRRHQVVVAHQQRATRKAAPVTIIAPSVATRPHRRQAELSIPPNGGGMDYEE